MTNLKDRGKAIESLFASEGEREFKVAARRNKLLGLWAAEIMGLEGEVAGSYALDCVKSDLEEPGDEDVYRKIKGDLENFGSGVSEHRVRKKMAELMEKVRQQIPK
ncbi:MAG: DUF1476 domain-containing protein [Sphingomonadales bacterium]